VSLLDGILKGGMMFYWSEVGDELNFKGKKMKPSTKPTIKWSTVSELKQRIGELWLVSCDRGLRS